MAINPARDPASEPREYPPAVDHMARQLVAHGHDHALAVRAARDAIAAGRWQDIDAVSALMTSHRLQRVINATGVLLHTNLGRAPWPTHHRGGPMNLEFDLDTGSRGHRDQSVAAKFGVLAGAEDVTIVNNGAAAVLLALAGLAAGGSVAVSRGELIEIGGGFRIPDVMEQSGATLIEVGTTNRTHLADYERAVRQHEVDLIMLVHRSNFEMSGFTSTVTARELAGIGVPVIVDLGSGLLDEACPWLQAGPPSWLHGEPAVRQTLDAGADLVVFSGDKLLGGPQAGLIAGRADLVERCRRHPLARALRCGGLVLDSLDSLADAYLERRGDEIAVWALATTSIEDLTRRAAALTAEIRSGRVITDEAVMGGGTLPGRPIESVSIVFDGDITEGLRTADVPVIARVHEGRTVVNLRSFPAADDALVATAVSAALE